MGRAQLLLNRALRRLGRKGESPPGDPGVAERLRLLLEDTLVTLGPADEEPPEEGDPEALGSRRRRQKRRQASD